MMCMKKDDCEYYISGALYSETTAQSYAQCVSECPYELPVHEDGIKMCTTCT